MIEKWRAVTLGDIAQISIGRTPPRDQAQYWTTDLTRPFCTIADLNAYSIDPIREGVTETAEVEGKAKRVPAGSLLMSFKLTIGRVGFAKRDLFPNEAIAWIEPNGDVSAEFLALFLSAQDLTVGSGRAVKGNTLNGASLRAIPIRHPRLGEQRRIVDLIGALDAQITAMDSERDSAWSFLKALRQDSLVGGTRIPLGQACSIESRLVDPREADYSGLLHIGIEAIEKATGRVGALRTAEEDGLISGKYLFSDTDVIYSKIRPNLRKVALPGSEGLCSADAYPLRPVLGLPASLLRETLLLDSVVDAAVASSGRTKMPKVNRKELLAIEVPLGEPDRWQQLAEPLEAVRSLAESIDEEVAGLRCLRRALLTNLVTGVTTLPERDESPEVAV